MWTVSGFQPRTAEHSLLSWAAADPFQLVKVFPSTITCWGFTSPSRDAAGLALHTLLKSWCQTLCFLITTSLSVCPAEPASDSLWSQAESQIFPSHPCRGGLALLPNAAFGSWRVQPNTRLFQIKTRSRVPSPKYYMAEIFTALSSLTRWSIWWLFRTQWTFFQNLLLEWVITAQFKNILDILEKAGLFCCLVFAILYSLQRWSNCHSRYNYPWKITDKDGTGLIVLKQ